MAERKKTGFALMTKERLQEVSAKGGAGSEKEKRVFFLNRELAKEAGIIGRNRRMDNNVSRTDKERS